MIKKFIISVTVKQHNFLYTVLANARASFTTSHCPTVFNNVANDTKYH